MRDMLLNASKSYYVGLINKHIANVEILLTRSVGIGEHQDIQQSIDAELDKVAMNDDKLNMIIKYFERRQDDATKTEEQKEESKSK
jgi:imidazole glycerol phosphate synthase subunit HisF